MTCHAYTDPKLAIISYLVDDNGGLALARRCEVGCEVGKSPTIPQYRSINIFQEHNL